MNEVKVTKDLQNKSLIIERDLDAPKDKVWKAFTDKDWFEKWWGPEGWVTTVKEFNFSSGGRVHYCMKCTDKNQGEWYGQESWGIMLIDTTDAPNKYTYKDYFSDENGALNNEMPALTIVNEFKEADGKTTLISKSVADKPEQIEDLIKMGMLEGFSSQLLKLDVLLAE